MFRSVLARGVLAAVVLIHAAGPRPAWAQDQLKVSVGARGAFEEQISEVGERIGAPLTAEQVKTLIQLQPPIR